MLRLIFVTVFIQCAVNVLSQQTLKGIVLDQNGMALPFANVAIMGSLEGISTDENGYFEISTNAIGELQIRISFVGYLVRTENIYLQKNESLNVEIQMTPSPALEEVVVTGTLKEISKKESPVPVEVYSPKFFKKNPGSSIYESFQNVNGVRPQVNCNVCNTGDIHINGLEGPYTMVLIDGMPIVGGLSTVYGLMGIPNSMVDQVEIVKGPASSLYGSEAIGGLINIITKNPEHHPRISFEMMSTSWLETSFDLGFRFHVGKKARVLTGIHLFNYDAPKDVNQDNFTDVSLSKRASIFQKWSIKRKNNRLFRIGGRYYTENRWGGELQWTPEYKGSDVYYGETIETNRFELMALYQMPFKEKMMFSFSTNRHVQDSYYGQMPFKAQQDIAFSQLTWNPSPIEGLTVGSAIRYQRYDDNTVVTQEINSNGIQNKIQETVLPGLFLQEDMELTEAHRILIGMRYDRSQIHGDIWTPRFAYKWDLNYSNTIRLNAGTGFRVINIFTEEHAALTGSREVVIKEDLDPERSYNINANYVKKIYSNLGNYWSLDCSVWYSLFTNKIIADYDVDPNTIYYENLNGRAVSKGVTINLDALIFQNWRVLVGATIMDLYALEKVNGQNLVSRPVLTEKYSGTWSISYTIPRYRITFDYTGNLYGPMRLPLLSELDPRNQFSPWWSIQNVQLSYASKKRDWDLFGGIKNIWNYLPPANSIARANDPFDKEVDFDEYGHAIPTQNNPFAQTFDPSYVFAPNQGVRFFAGIRYTLK